LKKAWISGLGMALCLILSGCGQKEEVVVYTAVEEVYCQELFEQRLSLQAVLEWYLRMMGDGASQAER